MNTSAISTLVLVILLQLVSDSNSQFNFGLSDQEINEGPRLSRPPRQRNPFSFFREFIEPLPGVLNDIFPSITSDDPVVDTRNGPLRGTIKLSRDGRKYSAFLGVPYAQPPQRFEAPQKLTTRSNTIRDATRYKSPCFHVDVFVTGRVRGSEDCLYANIYSTQLPTQRVRDPKLPVMVYIHGGGFNSGSGDFYQAKYFMDENIVAVIFNYRLSALGFLNTEDGQIRGNMGLKDQRMMLQWVQENIRNFGGDPEQVTIFGESAGAASVGAHVLSQNSKGLFHKAISLSGSPLNPWALSKSPAESARTLAKTAGCPTKNATLMVQCLRSVSPQAIAKGYKGMMRTISTPADFFAPSIETVVRSDTVFSEHPEVLLKRGNFNKVPLLLGVNSMEGLIYATRILADPIVKKNLGKRWNEWIPALLGYSPKNTTRTEKLKTFYFPTWKNGPLDLSDKKNFLNLTHLLSDALFLHPSHEMAKEYVKHAPLHLYYNTYQGRISVHDILSKVPTLSETDNELPGIPEVALGTGVFSDLLRFSITNERPSELGAAHGDTVMLLFNMRRAPGIGRLSMDYDMSKEFIKSLAEFASKKELSFDQVAWPKANDSPIMKYMRLDLPGRIINEPVHNRMEMWDFVY